MRPFCKGGAIPYRYLKHGLPTSYAELCHAKTVLHSIAAWRDESSHRQSTFAERSNALEAALAGALYDEAVAAAVAIEAVALCSAAADGERATALRLLLLCAGAPADSVRRGSYSACVAQLRPAGDGDAALQVFSQQGFGP